MARVLASVGSVLLLLLSSSGAIAANLLSNGDFGTGDFTGWIADRQWVVGAMPAGGSYAAQGIADLAYQGHLSQAVHLELGHSYNLSFDYAGGYIYGTSANISVGGMTDYVSSLSSATSHYSRAFVATEEAPLSFNVNSNGSFLYLDNVAIEPTASLYDEILFNAVKVTTSGYLGLGHVPCDSCMISAYFTPANGETIADAAADLGYIGFNWVQRVTSIPGPIPFSRADGQPVEFPSLDPPPGGWSYQPGYDAAPFYWSNALDPRYPGSFVEANIFDDGKVLGFVDDPGDPCLGPLGLIWPACEGEILPPDSAMYFATDLVGVNPDGTPGPSLFEFTWKSTYNGLYGGVARLGGYNEPDPGGTGGVYILSERYLIGAPEPPTWLLWVLGFGTLGSAIRLRDRKRLS